MPAGAAGTGTDEKHHQPILYSVYTVWTPYTLYKTRRLSAEHHPGRTTGTLPYANAGIVTGAKAP